MISPNEYDDIVTILCLPLNGANVVKELQKTYSVIMNFCFTISRGEIPSKNQYLNNLGKLVIYKKWPWSTLGLNFRVENRRTGKGYHSRRYKKYP